MTNQDQIQKYQDDDAAAAAHFCRSCLHHIHVGYLDCDDKFVIYHNRAGALTADLALKIGTALEAMGWDRFGYGESGPSFAWVVYNYERKPVNWKAIDKLLDEV